MILLPTRNKTIKLIFIIALLISGLFYYQSKKDSNISNTQNLEIVKPSQLNFTESNKISDPIINKTETTTPPNTTELPKLNEEELKTYLIIEEIIKSKNDNDARLDQQVKKITPQLRSALERKYFNLPSEERNPKGLIVFLIASNLKSAEDLEFIKKVYEESPCLALDDCKKNSSNENPHHSSVNETTLNYPQLVGLYQIEKLLNEHPEVLKVAHLREGILNALKTAENFAAPQVQQRAQAIREKFGL